MKSHTPTMIAFCVLLFAQRVDASPLDDPFSHYAVGVGASLNVENFHDRELDWNRFNSLNFSFLYRPVKKLAFELEHEALYNLKGTGHKLSSGIQGHLFSQVVDDTKLDAYGFLDSLSLRFYPGEIGTLDPYVFAGAGRMKLTTHGRKVESKSIVDGGNKYLLLDTEYIPRHTERALVYQVGAGVVAPLGRSLALEVEGSYKIPTNGLRGLPFYSVGFKLLFRF